MLETQDERHPNTPAVSRCALREHQQVLGAIRAGDADAAERLMRTHLTSLESRVRRLTARQRREQAALIPSLPARREQRAAAAIPGDADESNPRS
jgi:hypothetical protein